MRDGVVLRGDLWRPADGLCRPSSSAPRTTATPSNSDALRTSHCLDRGFAVLVQDTRGRFGSQGDWKPLMWDTEGLDGHDTVEWVPRSRGATAGCSSRAPASSASLSG